MQWFDVFQIFYSVGYQCVFFFRFKKDNHHENESSGNYCWLWCKISRLASLKPARKPEAWAWCLIPDAWLLMMPDAWCLNFFLMSRHLDSDSERHPWIQTQNAIFGFRLRTPSSHTWAHVCDSALHANNLLAGHSDSERHLYSWVSKHLGARQRACLRANYLRVDGQTDEFAAHSLFHGMI